MKWGMSDAAFSLARPEINPMSGAASGIVREEHRFGFMENGIPLFTTAITGCLESKSR